MSKQVAQRATIAHLEPECHKIFCIVLKYVKDFSDVQEQLTPQIHDRIWSNFELIRDFMVVLVIYKNEKHSIKNEGARVFTTL